MRKLSAIILMVAVCAVSVFAAGYSSAVPLEVYGGLGMEMASVSGMQDVRISDVKYYGLREGSLLLPLAESNGTSVPITLTIGVEGAMAPNFGVIAEICYGFIDGSSYAANLDVGGKYYFANRNFHFGAGVKAGVYYMDKSLGEAKILAGTTPPVILPEGTIYNGDKLTYTVYGMSITPMVDIGFPVSRDLTVGCNVGYQLGFSFGSEFKAGDVTVDPENSEDIYEASLIFKEIDLNPSVSLNGVKASFYVYYKL